MFNPYKFKSFLVLGAALIYLAFETFFQISVKFLVDYAIVPQQKEFLFLIIVSLLLGVLISLITGVLSGGVLYSRINADIISNLYLKIYAHLQKLSLEYFYRNKAGDILSRFNTDLQSLDAFLVNLPTGLAFSLSLVASIGLMIYLNWQLALLTLIGLPLYFSGTQNSRNACWEIKQST
ncbi:MAG: ABC transporter ATP-binding protein [Desulfosporosinus sp.]